MLNKYELLNHSFDLFLFKQLVEEYYTKLIQISINLN